MCVCYFCHPCSMYNMFYRLMFRVYCKWCEDQRWSAMLISWSTKFYFREPRRSMTHVGNIFTYKSNVPIPHTCAWKSSSHTLLPVKRHNLHNRNTNMQNVIHTTNHTRLSLYIYNIFEVFCKFIMQNGFVHYSIYHFKTIHKTS